MLNEIFQTKEKIYQMEMWVCAKELIVSEMLTICINIKYFCIAKEKMIKMNLGFILYMYKLDYILVVRFL